MNSQERPEGSFLNDRITTSTRLNHSEGRFANSLAARGLLVGVVLVGAAGAWKVSGEPTFEDFKNVYDTITAERPTDEQKEAAKFLAGDQNIIKNIVSIEVTSEDGEVIPINLRNKPGIPFDANDISGGEVIGKLNPGVIIDRAVEFEGNNPIDPRDRRNKSTWFAFYLPGDNETVYFAWVGNFKPNLSDYPHEIPASKM